MVNVGIPITVKSPDFPGGTAFQPTWETVIAPDQTDIWTFTGAQADVLLLQCAAGRRYLLSGVAISGAFVVAGVVTIHDGTGDEIVGPIYFGAQAVATFTDRYPNGVLLGLGVEIRMTATVTGEYSVQLVGKQF